MRHAIKCDTFCTEEEGDSYRGIYIYSGIRMGRIHDCFADSGMTRKFLRYGSIIGHQTSNLKEIARLTFWRALLFSSS